MWPWIAQTVGNPKIAPQGLVAFWLCGPHNANAHQGTLSVEREIEMVYFLRSSCLCFARAGNRIHRGSSIAPFVEAPAEPHWMFPSEVGWRMENAIGRKEDRKVAIG